MREVKRDLLLVAKNYPNSETAIEKEIENLIEILRAVEGRDMFCRSHELVTRYYITQNSKRIFKTIHKKKLKPFHFLLNKN